jgi:hypothetical protein
MTCMIPDNHLLWGGRLWCEPVTVATDWLLALLCLVLLTRQTGAARGFFLLSAVAFALGGLRHLLFAQHPDLVPLLSRASSTASALSLALLLLSLLPFGARGRAVIAAGTAAVIAGHLWLDHILLAVLHSAVTFTTALALAAHSGRSSSFRWFHLSFLLSLLAGLTFGLRLTPALFFNHNDLAHILLMGAYFALHRQLQHQWRGLHRRDD